MVYNLVGLILTIFLFGVFPGCQMSIGLDKKSFKEIPKEDQIVLERFFHTLFTTCCFGQTLFGDKPLSFQEYHHDYTDYDLQELTLHQFSYALSKGWKVWQQYQFLFPLKQFVFVDCISKNGQFHFLVLVNLRTFQKAFRENEDVFKRVLGSNIDAKQILAHLIEQKSLGAAFGGSELLLGIALGFGRENAERFERCIQTEKNRSFLDSNHYLTSANPPYQYELKPFDNLNQAYLMRFGEMNFRCIDHLEKTRQIKKTYYETQVKIVQLLEQKNWIDTILTTLTEN